MTKSKTIERGKYEALKESMRRKNDRYVLKLYIPEFNYNIFVDINDELYETIGTHISDSSFYQKLFLFIPNPIYVTNMKGFWEIENLQSILSDILTRII